MNLSKTSFHSSFLWIFLIPIFFWGPIGCTPLSDEEQAYIEQKEEEDEQQDLVSSALKGGTRQSEAIDMVKEEDAPDARGSMLEWVERQHTLSEEKIIFPRWKATARGDDKFEVIYEYSVVDEDYSSIKKGYSWSVDLVLKIVGSYEEIKDEDEGPQTTDQRVAHQLLEEQNSRRELSLE